MIIERLDLKAFGGFTDFSVDLSGGPHRFHILFGPNESGKSTSLRAINSFLFGFPRSTSDNYLHPNNKLRVGGRLVDEQISADHEALECVRKKGTKGTLRGADDKTVVADSVLSDLLGGIDRETFEHRFGLSHDELVRGGSQIIQGGGDLGSILFAAGAGVDRLLEIQTELSALGSSLFVPGGKNGSINQAIKAFRDQKKDLATNQLLPAEYHQRKEALEEKCDEIDGIQAELKDVAADLASMQRLRDAMPLIPKWKAVLESLEQIGDAPRLDDDFIERRRTTQNQLESSSQQSREVSERLEQLDAELAELPDDSTVVIYQAQIELLFQKLGAREEADDQCKDHTKALERSEFSIHEKLRDLKIELPASDDDSIDKAIERLRLSDSIQARVDELALKHARLVTQRDDAERSLDALSRRIDALEKELAESDAEADPESLSEVIDSVGKPDDLLLRLADQQANVDRAERSCQSIRRRLDGIEVLFEEASELRLPSETLVENAASRMLSASDDVVELKARQAELTDQRDEVNRRITTQQAGQPLPTLAELKQVRQDRDDLVSQLSDALRGKSVSEAPLEPLRSSIAEADQLVDAIRTHHEQVHRRSLDLAELDQLEREIVDNESAIESAVELLEAAEQEWLALWQSVGVVADTPKRMVRWVADHAQLVENVHQWREESSRLNDVQRRVESVCGRLRSALGVTQLANAASGDHHDEGPTLFDDVADEVGETSDMISLYQNATNLRRKLVDARQERLDLLKRLTDAKQQLPDAQSELQAKESSLAKWQKDWSNLTESFAQGEDAAPTVVVELMREINALTALKRERDALVQSIRAIDVDAQEFDEAVRGVAEKINGGAAESSEAQNSHYVIRDLFERLQAERSAAARRESLQKQIAEVDVKLVKAREVQAGCGITLSQLCEEAACELPAQLIEIERKSADRSEYLRQKSESEDKLRILAGSEPIEQLIQRADAQDEGVLDVEIETKSRLQEELKTRLSECESERGVLRLKFNEIDAGNSAADLSQSLQMLGGQLQRDANEFARLKIASMILQRSIEHYRAENQGPVLSFAQEIFRELTCNEYQELRVEYTGKDEPTLVGVKSSDATNLVPAALMSTGTADALYLSLRLASLKHQLSHGTKIPLIVDDCLVQLDDQRTIAALKVFAKLSLDTQVILFTHHKHLVDLATDNLKPDEFHSHSLAAS